MDQTLKLLAEKLGEERQRISDDLVMGRAEEHAQYMHGCGIIRGFDIAQGLLSDIAKLQENDND